jgi:hypothetical protein
MQCVSLGKDVEVEKILLSLGCVRPSFLCGRCMLWHGLTWFNVNGFILTALIIDYISL